MYFRQQLGVSECAGVGRDDSGTILSFAFIFSISETWLAVDIKTNADLKSSLENRLSNRHLWSFTLVFNFIPWD